MTAARPTIESSQLSTSLTPALNEIDDGDYMTLNMGPSHPSTHGVLRIILELDGEKIMTADPDVGYLHRGMEKIAETYGYNKFIPYTDRMDYLAPIANNIAVAMGIEAVNGIELPPRGQAIRVICTELGRISAHLLGLGAFSMDVGAMTVFLWTFREREIIYDFMESLTGARFTVSYTRVGGLARDLPDGWADAVLRFVTDLPQRLERDVENMLTTNRIWVDRLQGVGVISRELAIDYGLTGPNLRGSGVEWDLRKERPYLGYENYEFDVPVGEVGDAYDRYLCRIDGDQAERAHHPVRRSQKHAGRSDLRRGPQDLRLPEKTLRAHEHGGAHPPVHGGDRGPGAAARRALLRVREPEGRARFLRQDRRHRPARAAAHARALVREPVGHPLRVRPRDGLRHGRHPRQPRLRDGGVRPVSAAARPLPTEEQCREADARATFESLRPQLDPLVARYPVRAAAMLPVLWVVQRSRGWLTPDSIAEVATYLDVPRAHVEGVITFYTMFHDRPVGDAVVMVCKTLSCRLRGAQDVIDALEDRYDIHLGETTADGRYTIEPAECLGLCDMAPCMLVLSGERFARHGNLTAESAVDALERSGGAG